MAKDVSIFDGTQWVSIVGPPGADGKDGKDGSGVDIKGTAAVYPPDAAPTVGDMWITPDPVPGGFPPGTAAGDGLVWTGTAWNNVGGIRGPAGKDGANGADGAPGQDCQVGADGKDGLGFTFKGEFDPNALYDNNDVVTALGSTYVIVDQTVRGLVDPGDLKLLASKGDKGDKGDAGADAAAGADGAKGDKGDPGNDGAPGADGQPGADGADGRSVAVTKSPTQPATAAIGDFWIEE